MTAGVALVRGGVRESFHRIHAAVRGPDRIGGDRADSGAGSPEAVSDDFAAPGDPSRVSLGDPTRVTFLRSCAKPLQALPLVDEGVADRFGFGDEELAVCCASHSGEPEHLDRVRGILSGIGSEAGELECGVRAPLRTEAAEEVLRSGEEYGPLHNNCSGKHAGMLALARHLGWEPSGYSEAEHPVQRRMAAEMARWSGVAEEETKTATDGCGVVTFAYSLEATARVFARVAEAAAEGEAGPARIVGAMTDHPFLVGGTSRLDTELMEVAGDRLFVKSGAEGMICAGLPSRGLGIALKVEDGGDRAAGPALLVLLRELEVLDDEEVDGLLTRSRSVVTDTRDRPVGRLVVEGVRPRIRSP